MERSTLSKAEIAALAKAAALPLSEDRKQVMVETMPGIFQMLDSLHQVDPGETAPAFAFQAKSEKSA